MLTNDTQTTEPTPAYPLGIEPKVDLPTRLEALQGVPEKYWISAGDFNTVTEEVEALKQASPGGGTNAPKYRGVYPNLAALRAANPSPNEADYAYINDGSLRWYFINGDWQSENLRVQYTAIENYADITELLGTQGQQVNGGIYYVLDATDDPAVVARGTTDAYYMYNGVEDASINDYTLQAPAVEAQTPPIANTYTTQALMFADQSNQKTGFIYRVGFYTWEKLATSAGVIDDYKPINTGGLVQITENGRTGFALKGLNRGFKAPIGHNAIDLTIGGNGATGATGQDAFATGHETLAEGNLSSTRGANTIASGLAGVAEGLGNFSRSTGEHSGGVFGTDYSPTNGSTDRLVNHGNGNAAVRSDAYSLFKNGAQKFFSAPLATILNTVKTGFVMLDENFSLNIHNGTSWRRIAFADEIGGGGASYSQMYLNIRYGLPINGEFVGINEATGYTNGTATTPVATSVPLTYIANSRAVIIGFTDFAYQLEKVSMFTNIFQNMESVDFVVGYRDIRENISFNADSLNPTLIFQQEITRGSNTVGALNRQYIIDPPILIPEGKQVIIGYRIKTGATTATGNMWQCGTTLTLKKI